MTSKKAMLLSMWLVVIAFAALFTAWWQLSSKYNELSKQRVIGDEEFKMLQTYQESEKALFYIDQSAAYASQLALEDWASHGFFVNEPKCGSTTRNALYFAMWKSQSTDCFPDKAALAESFSIYLNKYLNNYFETFNKIVNKIENVPEIPKENYQFLIKPESIAGFALKDISIKKENIEYAVKPSFTIPHGLDLGHYFSTVEKAKEIAQECSKPENKDNKKSCVEGKALIYSKEAEWNVESKDNNFRFTINENRKTVFFNRDIIIRFALYVQ